MRITILAAALAAAIAAPVTAATIETACSGLAVAFRDSLPGDTIRLTENCTALVDVRNRAKAAPGVVVDLNGHALAGGLRFWGNAGFTFQRGAIMGGDQTNAVDLRDGERIGFADILFTSAHRGLRVDKTRDLVVTSSRFHGLRAEGLTAFGVGGTGLIRSSSFGDFNPTPTSCRISGPPGDGSIERGLSKSACTARRGTWTDGDHPDAVQVFGGWARMDIIASRIANADGAPAQTMGWTTHGKGPVGEVNLIANYSLTTFSTGIYHSALAGIVTGNTAIGAGVKAHAQIIQPSVIACGNSLPDTPASQFGKPCQ